MAQRSPTCSFQMIVCSFARATTQDCNLLLEILQQYEAASGQQINRDKTQSFLSPNIDQPTQESIKTLLSVSATSHYERYLGLPSFVGRGKEQSFSYLRERIWHKMQGWNEKMLS